MHLKPAHPAQAFFPFFSPLEIAVQNHFWEREVAKEKSRQERIRQKPKKIINFGGSGTSRLKAFLDEEPRILDLFRDVDFFDTVEVVQPSLPKRKKLDIFSSTDPKVSDFLTDADSTELHYLLLHRSMQTLASTHDSVGTAKAQQEIFEWIYFNEYPDEVLRFIDGKQENIIVPFTFGACCRFEGADPYEMRIQIKQMFKDNLFFKNFSFLDPFLRGNP